MRRKALIATVLLPLPFAALPLAGVLLGMGGGPSNLAIESRTAVTSQVQVDLSTLQTIPLARGVTDPLGAGCDTSPGLRSES